jgi:tetratricopeptide (TPR) repeat protein
MQQAQGYYEQALAIAHEVGDRAVEGTTLNNLGGLADDLGQPEQARSYFEQSLAIFQAVGAVDSARVVAENLTYFDGANTTSGAAPNALPAILPKKASPPKRRWPWQRKRTS